jgi:hypothetical protein
LFVENIYPESATLSEITIEIFTGFPAHVVFIDGFENVGYVESEAIVI